MAVANRCANRVEPAAGCDSACRTFGDDHQSLIAVVPSLAGAVKALCIRAAPSAGGRGLDVTADSGCGRRWSAQIDR